MAAVVQGKGSSLLAAALGQVASGPAAQSGESTNAEAAAACPKAKAMPTVPNRAATGALPKATPLVRKRGRVPDLDEALFATKAVVDAAKSEMKKAANLRRNAMRRRQRYIAKAAKCSNEDLYKIAVYKRTNFLAHIIKHDPQGLQGAIKDLLKNSDKESAMTMLTELADHASELPSSGASGSGSGGNGQRATVKDDLPQGAASETGTPLPKLPPLPAPMEMTDGSEQYAVPQAVDEPQETQPPEEAQSDAD